MAKVGRPDGILGACLWTWPHVLSGRNERPLPKAARVVRPERSDCVTSLGHKGAVTEIACGLATRGVLLRNVLAIHLHSDVDDDRCRLEQGSRYIRELTKTRTDAWLEAAACLDHWNDAFAVGARFHDV